ncbi:MAG: hypothetical protein AAF849_18805, partial [Bacteroidota bacterium]
IIFDPIEPNMGIYDIRRTDRFIKAFDDFQAILDTYGGDIEWQRKYEKSELSGRNCLKHYQLETYFAYEYMKNEAFRDYVDEQGFDGKQFKTQGFVSADKAVNLEKNMSSQCAATIKKMIKNEEIDPEGLKTAYNGLGVDLGYIDPNVSAIVDRNRLEAGREGLCKNLDCPDELMSIELNFPVTPDPIEGYTSRRTDRFKEAYLAFQRIADASTKNANWERKHEQGELGGVNCVRYYQLESYFANEYLNNKVFQQFIDRQGLNGEQFKRQGFDASRKGIRLEQEMSKSCPDLTEALQDQSPNTAGMQTAFNVLAKDLGIITEIAEESMPEDTETSAPKNAAKPTNQLPVKAETAKDESSGAAANTTIAAPMEATDEPAEDTPPAAPKNVASLEGIEDMNKRKQVEMLSERVAQLPNKASVMPQINKLTSDLADAATDLERLQKEVKSSKGEASDLKTVQTYLEDGLSGFQKDAKALTDFEPKLPNPALDEQVQAVNKRSDQLNQEAKALAGKGKDLNKKLGKVDKDLEKVAQDLADRNKAKADLLEQLDKVEADQQALRNELADKPKKKLEKLTKETGAAIADANKLYEALAEETNKGKALQNELAALEAEKEKLAKELDALQTQTDALQAAQNEAKNDYDQAAETVAAIQAEEAKREGLQDKMEALPSESALGNAVADCSSGMRDLKVTFEVLDEEQDRLREELDKRRDRANDLLDTAIELKSAISELKSDNNDDPLMYKIVRAADELTDAVDDVRTDLSDLKEQRSTALDALRDLNQNISDLKQGYNEQATAFNELETGLNELLPQKRRLMERIEAGEGDVDQLSADVDAFLKRFKVLEADARCEGLEDLEAAKTEIEDQQKNIQSEADELANALGTADESLSDLQAQLDGLRQKEVAETEKVEALQKEEEKMQEMFADKSLKIEPVPLEEWSEETEVARDAWETTLQEEEELVEGLKGRYYEVKLKRADEVVAILFPVGRYYMNMDAFNQDYGAAIGTFIYEATYHLDEGKRVKLFIQGSADATGDETFKGNLNSEYLFNEIDVLPKKSEGFENELETKDIPRSGFTNSDLPNLRAKYLKEIISFRSFDKLDAVLLDGVVTDTEDEKERNATLYLFISDEVLGKG